MARIRLNLQVQGERALNVLTQGASRFSKAVQAGLDRTRQIAPSLERPARIAEVANRRLIQTTSRVTQAYDRMRQASSRAFSNIATGASAAAAATNRVSPEDAPQAAASAVPPISRIIPPGVQEQVENLTAAIGRTRQSVLTLAREQASNATPVLRGWGTAIRNFGIKSLEALGTRIRTTIREYTSLDQAVAKSASAQAASERARRRTNQGAGNVPNNQSRQFAALTRTITDGVVPAYASLAANVFALSAAFMFLERAGDLTVLREGQVAYASATGRALRTLTDELVRATNAQITFEDASQAAAIGTAAGLNAEQLEDLAVAARDVSIILGRNVTDSFNRLVRGATKAEAELLDELGLIVRLGPATEKYASALGVSASSLDAYQRTQAFTNEIIEQARVKYSEILEIIEPSVNTFSQLGVAVDKSFRGMRRVISAVLGPVAELLASSDLLRNILISGFALSLAKTVLPAFDTWIKASATMAARLDQLRIASRKSAVGIQQAFRFVGASAVIQRDNITDLQRQATQYADFLQRRFRASPASVQAFRDFAAADSPTVRQVEQLNRTVFQRVQSILVRSSGQTSNAVLGELRNVQRNWDETLTNVRRRTVNVFQRMDVAVRQFGASASIVFANLRIAALAFASRALVVLGSFVNIVGILTATIATLGIGFNFVTKRLGIYTEESIKAARESDILTERFRSLNEEFSKFNAVQRTLLEDEGQTSSYFQSLSSRLSEFSVGDITRVFENARDGLANLNEEGRRRFGQLDEVSFIGNRFSGQQSELRDLLDSLLEDGDVLEEFFGERAPSAFGEFIDSATALRDINLAEAIANPDVIDRALARFENASIVIQALSGDFIALEQAARQNADTLSTLGARYIPVTEEEAFVDSLRQEVALRERLAAQSPDLEAEFRDRINQATLIADVFDRIDNINKEQARSEENLQIIRERSLVALQNGITQIRTEYELNQQAGRVTISGLQAEIEIVRDLANIRGSLNDQQQNRIDTLEREIALEASKLRTQRLQHRLAELGERNAQSQQDRGAAIALLEASTSSALTEEQRKQLDFSSQRLTLENERQTAAERLREIEEEYRVQGNERAAFADRRYLAELDTLELIREQVRVLGIEEDVYARIQTLEEDRLSRRSAAERVSIRNNVGLTSFQSGLQELEDSRLRTLEDIQTAREDINLLEENSLNVSSELQGVTAIALQQAKERLATAKAQAEATARELQIFERINTTARANARAQTEFEVTSTVDTSGLTSFQTTELGFEIERQRIAQDRIRIGREASTLLENAIDGQTTINFLEDESAQTLIQQLLILGAQERALERNIALRQEELDLQSTANARARAISRIRSRAFIGQTRGQSELIEQEIRQLEIDFQRRTVQEELTFLSRQGRDIDRQRVLDLENQLRVLNAQEETLNRQRNTALQIYDAARQGLEDNLQSTINDILTGAESSFSDAALNVLRGTLENVAGVISEQITNAILGLDPISVARKQAAIQSDSFIKAGEEVAGKIETAMLAACERRDNFVGPPSPSNLVDGRSTEEQIVDVLKPGLEDILTRVDDSFGNIFTDMRNFFSQIPVLLSNTIGAILPFASGGLVRGGVQGFQTGGIVTRPTLAAIGEGGQNEAIVPLPNGRSIPVDFQNSTGAGVQNNIVVNVNVTSDGEVSTNSPNNSPLPNIGQAIAQAVKRELDKESRPGGKLSRYGVA